MMMMMMMNFLQQMLRVPPLCEHIPADAVSNQCSAADHSSPGVNQSRLEFVEIVDPCLVYVVQCCMTLKNPPVNGIQVWAVRQPKLTRNKVGSFVLQQLDCRAPSAEELLKCTIL